MKILHFSLLLVFLLIGLSTCQDDEELSVEAAETEPLSAEESAIEEAVEAAENEPLLAEESAVDEELPVEAAETDPLLTEESAQNDAPAAGAGTSNEERDVAGDGVLVRNLDSPDYYEPGTPTEDCQCVPVYLCEDGEVVEDGSNILDPRKRPSKPAPVEVPLEEKYTPPECGPYHVCCKKPEVTPVRPYEHRCGTRNPGGIVGRILNNQKPGLGEAEFGEWPWQAAILFKDHDDVVFKCGGTLIDDRHVITVAHCAEIFLDRQANMVVRLGEYDTQMDDEKPSHEDFEVEAIVLHPQYRKSNLFNDIAVIKLADKVIFKPHIDTACLPHDEDDFSGKNCVATGWGTNAYTEGQYSVKMKEVTMPVLDNTLCQSLLRHTRLGPRFKLYSGFICAGGREGEDSCKGDGGGPLVCFRPDDNSYTVAGLTAWGISCGQKDVPGVYVNVKKYLDWISSVTGRPIEVYWNKP